MGVKGYVLIRMDRDVAPQECMAIRHNLESINEVVSVDCVIDTKSFDALALVDAPVLVSDVADKIQRIHGVASAEPARIVTPPQF